MRITTYPGTKEEIKAVVNTLKSFRLHASQQAFIEVFGHDIGELFWKDYTGRYQSDLLAFYGYLDDAYKEVFFNYLLTGKSVS